MPVGLGPRSKLLTPDRGFAYLSSLSSCVLALRADIGTYTDAGKTTPAAYDDLVATWEDQSSSSHDGVTAGDVERGYLRSGGQNGHDYIDIDRGTYKTGYACGFNVPEPFTIAAVWSTNRTAGYGRVIQAGPTNNWMMGPRASGGNIDMFTYGGVMSTAVALDTGETVIQTVTQNSGSISHYKNGSLQQTFAGNTMTPSALFIGSPFGSRFELETLNGHVYEVFVFDAVLGASDLADLHTYLTDRYNL